MALRLRLDHQAREDLAGIRSFLVESAGPAAADRVRRHIRERFELLRSAPMIGTATTEPGIRALSPTRYPYRIYYTITADAVVILHVRHTSRRTPSLGELKG